MFERANSLREEAWKYFKTHLASERLALYISESLRAYSTMLSPYEINEKNLCSCMQNKLKVKKCKNC